MENQEKGWKYEFTYKREPVKGQDGFTVSAFADDESLAETAADTMYDHAKGKVTVEKEK